MSKFAALAAASRADSHRAGPNGSARVMLAAGAALALHVVVLMPMRLLIVSGPVIQTAPSMTVRMVSSATSVVADAHLTAAAAVAAIEALQSSLPTSPLVASRTTAATSRTGTASKVDGDRRSVAAAATAAAAASSPTQPPSLPPAPDYAFAGKLDPGPRPLQDIEPIYPVRAGQQQGVVVLRLLIDERGVVDNVAVVRATPPGFFEEAAVEAFALARFSPGKLLGIAVKSQVTIEVEFTPINRGANVSGRTY